MDPVEMKPMVGPLALLDVDSPPVPPIKRKRGRPRKYPRPDEPEVPVMPSSPSIGRPKRQPPADTRSIDVSHIILTDFQSQHYQLEVLEHRIQVGDDETHGHPALAVELLPEFDGTTLTYEEHKLKTNYDCQPTDQLIPQFWEHRSWDDTAHKMSPDDSANLRRELSQFTQNSVPRDRPHFSGNSRKHRRELRQWLASSGEEASEETEDDPVYQDDVPRPRTSPLLRARPKSAGVKPRKHSGVCVKLDFDRFITDDTDFETDFEDF
jgi:hypothetical protein